jgi:hypothetical protein
MRDRILELLKQRPFQPFRIHLSNGNTYVVRHPEQVMMGPAQMVVGIAAHDAPNYEVADFAIVSLLHVTELVLLATPGTVTR